MTESEYFQSEEFKKSFSEQVEKDTWGKGKPMIYVDKEGNTVKHFKDGRIDIIKNEQR